MAGLVTGPTTAWLVIPAGKMGRNNEAPYPNTSPNREAEVR